MQFGPMIPYDTFLQKIFAAFNQEHMPIGQATDKLPYCDNPDRGVPRLAQQPSFASYSSCPLGLCREYSLVEDPDTAFCLRLALRTSRHLSLHFLLSNPRRVGSFDNQAEGY